MTDFTIDSRSIVRVATDDSVKFSAIKGMMWRSFVESKYNNGDFEVKDNAVYYTPLNDFVRSNIYVPNMHAYSQVSLDDTIDDTIEPTEDAEIY